MDISDSFTTEAVIEAGVALTEDEVSDLETWLREVSGDYIARVTEADDPSEQILTIEEVIAIITAVASTAFVAGRAYEEQFHAQDETFPLDLDRETLGLFISFLTKRAQGR